MVLPNNIRKPALAGRWYDADPKSLLSTIERYLSKADISGEGGDLIGLISPHAGYIYSGQVAAYAYKQLVGKQYKTVIVVAPSHLPGVGFCSVLTRGGYETPLGIVEVDKEISEKIVLADNSGLLRASAAGHTTGYGGNMEHSLEIQLPFLQAVLGSFKLVPIIMGNQSADSASVLSDAIAEACHNKNVLILASSDLSHFHDKETALMLDYCVKNYVEAYNPEGLLAALENGECEACGGGPIAAVMMAARKLGASKAEILKMADSGDISGDKASVVGYMSAALWMYGKRKENTMENSSEQLSPEEREILRTVVADTLESVVSGKNIPVVDNFEGKLGQKSGAFVTLKKNGRLRGCIGNIFSTKPLITTIAEMTRAAALEDPRFSPVSPEELPHIEFEISVLTPIHKVEDISEISPGRDGLIITKGWNCGLLLPQVAAEYGWDSVTFLEQTCSKAGLPKNAWKEHDTIIESFSAEVFS